MVCSVEYDYPMNANDVMVLGALNKSTLYE